jgi:hypothetical protein
MTLAYLTHQTLCREHVFAPMLIQASRESIVYHVVVLRPCHPFDYLACPFASPIYLVTSVNVEST